MASITDPPFLIDYYVHDSRERFGFEAGSPDQCTVDVRPANQTLDMVGFDAPTVKDSRSFRNGISEHLLDARSDEGVHLFCCIWSRGTPGTNRPYGLVSENHTEGLRGCQVCQSLSQLRPDHRFRSPGVALFKPLAYAHNWDQSDAKSRACFLVHRFISLTVVLSSLGMADDDVTGAGLRNH